MSAIVVSLEKRLIIRPSGLEVKKSIEAWTTLLSMVLWRLLLRWRRRAETRKAVNPEIPIAVIDTKVNYSILAEERCSWIGEEAQEERKKRT